MLLSCLQKKIDNPVCVLKGTRPFLPPGCVTTNSVRPLRRSVLSPFNSEPECDRADNQCWLLCRYLIVLSNPAAAIPDPYLAHFIKPASMMAYPRCPSPIYNLFAPTHPHQPGMDLLMGITEFPEIFIIFLTDPPVIRQSIPLSELLLPCRTWLAWLRFRWCLPIIIDFEYVRLEETIHGDVYGNKFE